MPRSALQCDATGIFIEVAVWDIPLANFGAIVAELSSPLGIGNLQLEDGSWRVYTVAKSHQYTI